MFSDDESNNLRLWETRKTLDRCLVAPKSDIVAFTVKLRLLAEAF